LLHEYNPRCIPPWDLTSLRDEKDFRRKITEARKNPPKDHKPGWLLNDYSHDNNNGNVTVDIASIISHSIQAGSGRIDATENSIEVSASRNLELDFLCQPTGMLGEMCSWLNDTALVRQPFISLAASLTFLGALFGRKIRDKLGGRTNLYCMSIANSSAGKNHVLTQIRELCMAAECVELLGGSDIASDTALEDRMSISPTTLFLLDEIGHYLIHIKSGISGHHALIVSALMKLYSSAGSMYLGKEYASREHQRTII